MSTNLISGLSSGIDWRTMVDQLITVEHGRVDVASSKKTDLQKKLTEWQSLNTKLLALKTAAGDLRSADDFRLYKATMTTDSATVNGSDLMSVSAASTASVGAYTLRIGQIASAQKLSSNAFSSASGALGGDFAGDILINGQAIHIAATDSLADVRDRINLANSGANPSGVTAGVIAYGPGDYRLILTSDETGADGIDLRNGSASDLLYRFGFLDAEREAKHRLAGGDRTDRFTSTSVSIQSLLGLNESQASGAGEIVISGLSVGAIDLGTDTLSSIETKFNAAGLNASVITETENGQTYYRLLVAGSANTYTDKNNILETLGVIKGGVSDVAGVAGDIANTSAGAVVTADTLLKDIDGYTGFSATDYLHLQGTDTDNNPVDDSAFVLSEATTVGDLLAKIETVFGDVTASVDGGGRLSVVSNAPGASPLRVQIVAKNSGGATDPTLRFDADGDLGSAATVREREIVAGADATLTVDGVTVTRAGNAIDDLIEGITLDLHKADTETTITLRIGRDVEAIAEKIDTFVSAYNGIASYISAQTAYDATKQQAGGVLFADGTLASVKSDLTAILVQNVWGVTGDYSTLGLVGIHVDRNGQLTADGATLRGLLATNFNDVEKLFTAQGTTSDGALSFISHTIATREGEYAVHIDTAATRGASSPSDASSLGGNETLTIEEGSKSATIMLTGGMSMTQIANAINSELASAYTQILAGGESLYADAGQAAFITAATTWDLVHDGAGMPANLANGDTISFSGTTRNGAGVSGSYTIANVETDTIRGLLSAIEAAFGNGLTAAIDETGRISVADRISGASAISLAVDCGQAHDLDFGTVLTANAGGRTGRYAVPVTASVDSGNHLVLTHDNYGSGNSFVIRQQNDLLWTGGDQTVDNGVDVAGTINGEAAAGNGQVLQGNQGAANTEGLVIRYTGTTAGNAGTIKLTFGVAELFDRALYGITDSVDGYVSFKQESLQESIRGIQTRIDDMEAQLDRKREQMINRYVQMELALQQIQNQSNWFTGQAQAAFNAWQT